MMEMQAREMLEKQASRLKNYPDMQARVQQHVHETERQAQRLQECIQRLDSGSSMLKDMSGKIMGTMGALMTSMSNDEVVKNVIGNFAFENFEIAAYRSLISAAEAAGDSETAQVCREILREEEDMAAFVEAHSDGHPDVPGTGDGWDEGGPMTVGPQIGAVDRRPWTGGYIPWIVYRIP